MKVQKASLAEIPAIAEIADESRLSEWSSTDYEAAICADGTIFLIASDKSDSVIGFVIGRIIPGNESAVSLDAEIYNIAVKENYRRQNVGSTLILAFLAECSKRTVKNVWLEVRAENSAAQAFYEKHNFKPEFIRKGYYHEPVEDAIVMRTIL